MVGRDVGNAAHLQGMTTTTPAPAPTAVTVTLPADDLELTATTGIDVVAHLEANWHQDACMCLLDGDECVTYGERWRDYAPITWMPEAVLVALREVVAAQQAEAAERPAA